MNDQRKVVFEQRQEFMDQESVRETIDEMRHGIIDDIVARAHSGKRLCRAMGRRRPQGGRARVTSTSTCRWSEWAKEEGIADEEMRERLRKAADEAYAQRVETQFARRS